MLIFRPLGVGDEYKSIIFFRILLIENYIDNMQENIDNIIKLAWCDKTSFEKIKRIHGVTESEVIKIMRTNLKPRSFKLWRTRVTGRTRKHEKKRNLSEKSFKYESYL